jgi:DNA-directed RNA polymerase subunit K/omega
MKKHNKHTDNHTDKEIVLETDDVVEADNIEEDGELEQTEDIEQNEDIELEQNEDFEEDFEKDKIQDENENDDAFNDCIDIEEPEINISDAVIDDSKRTSKNKMTRYEFVRIIGERIMQLTKGAKPLIKQNKQSMELSYKEIAIEELKANMIPFKIRRFVKDHYEIWKIEELNKKHLEPLFY